MNKLVSRKPIQRFKEGKKIEKFQAGGPWAGYYTVGNWPRNEVTPRRKTSGVSQKKQIAQAEFNRRVAANPELLNQAMGYAPPQFVPKVQTNTPQDGSYYEKTVDGKVVERGRWQGGKQVPFTTPSNEPLNGGVIPEVIVLGKKKTIQQTAGPIKSNKSGISFKLAFGQARNSGLQEFTWNGKRYNTMKAGETKDQWLAGLKRQQVPELPQIATIAAVPMFTAPKFDQQPVITNAPKSTYNFNRSQTRQLMRNAGYNPYEFTGAQRKALRLYLNGQSNDISQLEGIDLGKFKFKNGGILPSGNALTRFKQRNIK